METSPNASPRRREALRFVSWFLSPVQAITTAPKTWRPLLHRSSSCTSFGGARKARYKLQAVKFSDKSNLHWPFGFQVPADGLAKCQVHFKASDVHRLRTEISDIGYDPHEFRGVCVQFGVYKFASGESFQWEADGRSCWAAGRGRRQSTVRELSRQPRQL